MTKIIGITLCKNEDLYIKKAIESTIDFCDEFIVLDNHSTDNTWSILNALKDKYPKISLQRWDEPLLSSKPINKYVGEDCWVFGVDGDEIYDAAGLKLFKEDLLSGTYDEYFNIKGPSLHCCELNPPLFKGYMLDGTKSICKLYNMKILESWNQHQRLHGQLPVFNKKIKKPTLSLGRDNWDSALFRCLHMCFVKRSSLDKTNKPRIPPSKNDHKNLKYKGRTKMIEVKADFYEST